MASLLYDVQAVDPLTYAAVAAGLIVVAALASYLPARRASAVDPAESLRPSRSDGRGDCEHCALNKSLREGLMRSRITRS